MKELAGGDLGKRKSQIKVADDSRKVVKEAGIGHTPEAFKSRFRKYTGRIDALPDDERAAPAGQRVGAHERGEVPELPQRGSVSP